MTVEKNAVTFEKVDYSVEGIHILQQITGEVAAGNITTVVGPSGAGKTTLFKLCNGLQSPNSGSIYIQNHHIDSYDPIDLRRKVGIALQNATMINGTIWTNLELPLKLQSKELSEDRASELLNLVGLEEAAFQKKTKDLSGGQQQKLSIARTLVNQPDILLLDEITSSLDSVSRQDIEELIANINQEYGTTILWITHNLQQALDIGDDTWVMMDGEVVETGPSHFLKNPKNDRVKQFVRGEIE
ncbi:ABC transporter ATP-binding protein [Lentibacillus salinarum]|uniref:ABC transporter ATP-binding protein n=1 Tax=Lentibacillus salinarum TaxID=446820 RepID=UPI0036D41EB6